MPRRLLAAAFGAVLLASCSGSGDKSSTTTTTPFFQETTTSTLAATPVVARFLSPEKGSVQGTGGRGMVVVLTFTAKDATLLSAELRLAPASAATAKPGHSTAFPGLVVALSTTGTALGGPTANLANLFQIVTRAVQPDGSAQVSAVWTNAQTGFGSDVDATLVAFAVSGTAPDTVPATLDNLDVISNPAEVTFHVSSDASAAASTSSTSPSTPSSSSTTVRSSTTTTRPTSTTAASTTTTTRPAAATTTVPATTTTTKFLGLF
jgi:cell division septation protein DedD